uniref:Uncharacterized protein n=1 Tax=Arundo donax TaxID=35708 RepID=A0A0A9FHU8_ARUDO
MQSSLLLCRLLRPTFQSLIGTVARQLPLHLVPSLRAPLLKNLLRWSRLVLISCSTQ